MFDLVIASDLRDIPWVNERRSKVEKLETLLSDRAAFRSEVQALLNAQRSLFKLVPFSLP